MPKSGDISNSDDAGARDRNAREVASMNSGSIDAVASSAESSIFVAPLRWLTRASLRWPRTFLLVAVVLGVASAAYTGWCLKFRTNRLDLLNPNSGYNQRWLDYLREFGEQDEVVVVIEGDDPESVVLGIDAMAESLSQPGLPFESILYRYDPTPFKAKALQFAELEDLQRLDQFLAQLTPFLSGKFDAGAAARSGVIPLDREAAQGELAAEGVPLESADVAGGSVAEVPTDADPAQAFSKSLQAVLEGKPYAWPFEDASAEFDLNERFQSKYLTTADGLMGFVTLHLAVPPANDLLVRSRDSIEQLQRVVKEVSNRHPNLRIGATGLPLLEHDEMHSSQGDMTLATIVSFAGVALLLLAGFGSWRYTLVAVVILLFGMAWSFGFVTLAVGHLNILSISFAAILIGLGIDFGIHYLARYLQLRNEGRSLRGSLLATATEIGPGVITGAVTTAVAFYAAALTEFTGIVELGIIAGTGILLCLAAAVLVLPPLVLRWEKHFPLDVEELAPPLPFLAVLQPFLRRPRLTICGFLLLAALVVPGVTRVRYDHNLLNLQPVDQPSAQWQRRLISRDADNVWFAVSMVDNLQTARRREEAFERLGSVARTESLARLFPVVGEEKRELLQRIHGQLASLLETPASKLLPLESLMGLMQQMQASSSRPNVPVVKSAVDGVRQEMVRRRLQLFRENFLADLMRQAEWIAAMSNPEPLKMVELPAEIRDRFVSDSGRFLVRVYSRGDIWDMESLQRFVADVESVDGRITGHPIQTYYASRQMQQSYLHSAIYALFAVMIVLVVDFRSIGYSLLAMMPLALGIWLLIGIMGLLDIPFNAANMIVLPLILGIGIDSGVHIVHDYRSQGSRFRLTNSVATSIVICSATTMTGFCSMIFANHLGLRSLGQVLVLGLFCSLVSSLLFLPAWILARPVRNRASKAPDTNAPDTNAPEASAPEASASGRARYRRNRIGGSMPSSSDSQAASLLQRPVPVEPQGAVIANSLSGVGKKSAT